MIKKIIISAAAILLCIAGRAQQQEAAVTDTAAMEMESATVTPADSTEATPQDTTFFSRNIKIEKDYIPEIKEAKRPAIELKAHEIPVAKSDIEYSVAASSIVPRSEFHPIDPAKFSGMKRRTPKEGYASASIGYPLQWNAQAFYPLINSDRTYFDINAYHNGIYTDKRLIDTDLRLNFSHKLNRDMAIYAAAGYNNDYYNYYGDAATLDNGLVTSLTDSAQSALSRSVHHATAEIGLRSLSPSRGWTYDAMLNYDMTAIQGSELAEHQVNLTGFATTQLGGHTLCIGLHFMSALYSASAHGYGIKNNAVFGLSPAYDMEFAKYNLKLRVGAKLFFSFLNGRVVNAMPDVKLTYDYGNLLRVYAGAGGNYQMNTLSTTLAECRYYSPLSAVEKNTYTPLDAFAGIDIKPVSGLLINAHLSYRMMLDAHFLRNETTPYANSLYNSSPALFYNTFTAEYSNAGVFNVGVRADYTLRDRFNFFAAFDYNHWSLNNPDMQAWYKPAIEALFGAEAEVIKGLRLKADFYLATGRTAGFRMPNGTILSADMRNIYDLNISASYTFLRDWTVFLAANNILGASDKLNYQWFYGYDTIGFNIMAGVNLAF